MMVLNLDLYDRVIYIFHSMLENCVNEDFKEK